MFHNHLVTAEAKTRAPCKTVVKRQVPKKLRSRQPLKNSARKVQHIHAAAPAVIDIC